MTIVGENAGNLILKDRLSELFRIIELLEREKENATISRNSINLMESIASNTVQQKDVAYVTKHEEKLGRDIVSVESSDTTKVEKDIGKEEYTSVSGKKCFYYAKSMCLCQKKRCTIVDVPCEYYVSKNSKELLNENDFCRNLIKYTRRGKVQRVECLISGLPGCIGEECKFSLKKNKKK